MDNAGSNMILVDSITMVFYLIDMSTVADPVGGLYIVYIIRQYLHSPLVTLKCHLKIFT